MLIVGRASDKIRKLKIELSESFAMKDLGPAKQILGLNISHDKNNGKLWLLHEKIYREGVKAFQLG